MPAHIGHISTDSSTEVLHVCLCLISIIMEAETVFTFTDTNIPAAKQPRKMYNSASVLQYFNTHPQFPSLHHKKLFDPAVMKSAKVHLKLYINTHTHTMVGFLHRHNYAITHVSCE